MVEGASSLGIPAFENPNGRMMEGDGGSSLMDAIIENARRHSIFRSYVFPYMDRPNLTVLSQALVTSLILDRKRATGVKVAVGENVCSCTVRLEVVLSLGAINTPRLLMQSGIGDEAELGRLGIPVVQHLPAVGRNFQDHFLIASCLWEYPEPFAPCNNATEEVTFWKSAPSLDTPDMQLALIELPYVSAELAQYNPPAHSWGVCPGIVRPKSRGHLRLTGVNPLDPIKIVANTVSEPDDLKAAVHAVDVCREIGNSVPLRPFVKREVMPTGLKGAALEIFVRDGAMSYFHQSCTAKMGRDEMSVVDN